MTARISAVDSGFLDAETGDTPSVTIGACMIVDGQAPELSAIRELIRSRRTSVSRLFQRLERSSVAEVNRAKWVDDEPDLEYHVAAGEIGDDPRGLNGAVAKLMERQLDRDRPLWEATVFAALNEPDKWAIVWRLHHTIADGQGASMLIGNLCELSAEGGITLTDFMINEARVQLDPLQSPQDPAGPMADGMDEVTVGAALKTALEGLNASAAKIRQAAALVPNTVRSLLDFAPHTPSELTGVPTHGRSWAALEGSLAAAKTVGHALDSTVNDVILAAVALGFRAVLQSRGTDTTGMFVRFLMPVSLRDPRDATSNNQVTILPVVLPLDADDPRALIEAVHASTSTGLHSLSPQISDGLVGLATRFVPNLLQEAVAGQAGHILGYFGDTCVTNVRGPQMPIYFMGQQISAQYPVLPIAAPLRLGVAISSLTGRLQITVTGDDQSWDEVELLAATIAESLEQMAAG
ncbi:MAG: wax ester/triacylglycerol synthase domain-containing protein [Actinomycetes bacterium]